MLLDFENKFAFATDKTTTQGLSFEYNSIMFFDRLEYLGNGCPRYSFPSNLPNRSTLVLPSDQDYLHINLLYCQGQWTQGYI